MRFILNVNTFTKDLFSLIAMELCFPKTPKIIKTLNSTLTYLLYKVVY